MPRRTLIAAVTIAALGATAATIASAAPTTSILWAGEVPTATIARAGSATTLSVPSAAPLTWFTDHPARKAGTTTVRRLASHWKQWGFTTNPPNAAIAIRSGGKRKTYVVTLSSPKVSSTTTRFRARAVPNMRVRGMSNMGTIPRGTFRDAGLFIDSGGACGPYYIPLGGGTDCEGLSYSRYTVSAPPRGSLRSITLCEDDSNRSGATISGGGVTVWDGTPGWCRPAPQYSFGADGGATITTSWYTTHIYVTDAVIPCSNPITQSANGCRAEANTTYSIAPSAQSSAWVMTCLPAGPTTGSTLVSRYVNRVLVAAFTPPACGTVDGQPSALVGGITQAGAIQVYQGQDTSMRTADQAILLTYSG